MHINTPLKKLLFGVLRLEIETAAGVGGGTAWAFGYQKGDAVAPFLVASSLAVGEARRGRICFTLSDGAKPRVGYLAALDFDDFGTLWHRHPMSSIDIAVTPLAPLLHQLEGRGHKAFCPLAMSELIPTPEELDALDVREEVVLPGFAVSLFDVSSGLPLLVRGTTATPVHLDYRGHRSFLVSAPIWPGCAGSPVLLVAERDVPEADARVGHTLLLGTLSCAAGLDGGGRVHTRPIAADRHDPGVLDIGVVWKSALVVEAVEACLSRADGGERPTASP